MNNNPEYVKIGNKRYKINTDFRVAIKCNTIFMDENIGDYEKQLAIIYLLFGDEGLDDKYNHNNLLKLAELYLNCGEKHHETNKKPDMDFEQDKNVIASSFKYDYKYNPYETKYLHWYDFYNDLANLSNSEFGTCCALNRLRNFRNLNPNEIKDDKKRQEVIEEQKRVAVGNNNHKEKKFTQEEMANMNAFNSLLGKE